MLGFFLCVLFRDLLSCFFVSQEWVSLGQEHLGWCLGCVCLPRRKYHFCFGLLLTPVHLDHLSPTTLAPTPPWITYISVWTLPSSPPHSYVQSASTRLAKVVLVIHMALETWPKSNWPEWRWAQSRVMQNESQSWSEQGPTHVYLCTMMTEGHVKHALLGDARRIV